MTPSYLFNASAASCRISGSSSSSASSTDWRNGSANDRGTEGPRAADGQATGRGDRDQLLLSEQAPSARRVQGRGAIRNGARTSQTWTVAESDGDHKIPEATIASQR